MPRYLVEPTFRDGLQILANVEGARVCQTAVTNNADDLVTLVHPYVSVGHDVRAWVYHALIPRGSALTQGKCFGAEGM